MSRSEAEKMSESGMENFGTRRREMRRVRRVRRRCGWEERVEGGREFRVRRSWGCGISA
jgi:hypothetical protein